MLNTKIKEATKAAHQQLEAIVVRRLKEIRSNADYADLLKHFYAYFLAIEQAIAPYITMEVLQDYGQRRNSSYIKADIEQLGGTVEALPLATVPAIGNTLDAFSALYVLEGSIMGGPYIVQMLAKHGIHQGVSFFSGYGEDTGKMWASFTEVLNSYGADESVHPRAIAVANETFTRFGEVFHAAKVI